MKEFFERIEAKLQAWNILFPRWSGFANRMYSYCSGIKNSNIPWYGKGLKVVCDAFDLVVYNAYAFMGMLLCACLLF